nr:PREDICTED: homeobox protein NANOG [Rhinolophus sinicus]
MSVDLACPQSPPCPEASNSRDSSPEPEIYGPEENYASLQMSSAETLHTENVSPLPSSMDLLIQNSPDSSTSPSVILPTSVENTVKKEEKVQVKKQKIRTVFSQTQLCVLNERFQRQKYLSLQQMQELSNILNLSYKQIKTWFQNQRMKCKRWQKYNWPKNSSYMTRKGSATAEYPGLSSCHQGCLLVFPFQFVLEGEKHTELNCLDLLKSVWIRSSEVGGIYTLLSEFQASNSWGFSGLLRLRSEGVLAGDSVRPSPASCSVCGFFRSRRWPPATSLFERWVVAAARLRVGWRGCAPRDPPRALRSLEAAAEGGAVISQGKGRRPAGGRWTPGGTRSYSGAPATMAYIKDTDLLLRDSLVPLFGN